MKKKILISILLLVCFWHFNVKAEELITDVPEPVAGEVTVQEDEVEEEKEKPPAVVSSDNSNVTAENSENVFEEENHENDVPVISDVEEKIEEKNIEGNNEENPALTNEDNNNVETDDELVEVDNNINNDEEELTVPENPEVVEGSNEVVEENNEVVEETIETVEPTEEITEVNNEPNYNVTFVNGDYRLNIVGGSNILLSELLANQGINISLSDIAEIRISNNELLRADKLDNNDYDIVSLNPFNTTEKLFIVLNDGSEIVITVVDGAGDEPEHLKLITDNQDGTYTIELTVTGDADNETQETGGVNVVVVYDVSQSMTSRAGSSRYSRSDQAEAVVHDFLTNLAKYQNTNKDNINVSLVNFAVTASEIQGWTTNVTALANRFDGNATDGDTNFTYNGYGTNWESALQRAQTLVNSASQNNNLKNNPTFVILITDGAPTASGNGNNAVAPTGASIDTLRNRYDAATNEAAAIASAIAPDGTFYGIYAYGTEADLLDDLMYYSVNNGHRDGNINNVVAATQEAPNYFNAGETSELQAAIDEIFDKVVQAMGITSAAISDGTTNKVKTSTGEIAELLEVDEGSYEYYLSIPVVNNSFTRVDRDGNTITYTVSTSGDNATITWGTNSVTVNGTVTGGQLKYKWVKNALYNYDVPEAHLVNGAVDWDLSSVGTLLDGVTYSVKFTVYPSQETLDIIADIKNNPGANGAWKNLDSEIKKYIDVNGNLKTNTTATLHYEDTRTGQSDDATYNELDPVPTNAVESIAVTKVWNNSIDGRAIDSVKITVTRDGEDKYEMVLSDDNNWKNSVYISVGIIKNGEVLPGSEGHDFTFTEPTNLSYHWELDVPVVHPMLIDGELTMLVKKDEKHPLPSGAKTYTINGDTYYVDNASVSLTATNDRRSRLFLQKLVTGENVPEDATFPFVINVKNSNAPNTEPTNDPNHDSDYWVWVSIFDADGNGVDEGVEGATNYGDGYWYAPSGTDITVQVKVGYSVMVNNLPTGTTYTITEGTLATGFVYNKTELRIDGTGTDSTFTAGLITTGTIESTNTKYYVDYTNDYVLIDVVVTKVWEDNSNQDGIRPDELTLTLNGVPEGTTVDAPEVTKSEDGNTWTYTWKAVPKLDSDGNEITYTVTEDSVPKGYTCTGSPASNGGTITNTHTPATDDVVVTKVWEDDNNHEGFRPDSITIHLFANGTEVTDVEGSVEKNNDNTWTITYAGLDVYAGGSAISYTVTEDKVTNYETKIEGLKITNSRKVETDDVIVTKIWKDNSNKEGLRPGSITIHLFANGTEVKTVTGEVVDNKDNTWTITYKDLDVYANGSAISYTVTEDEVTYYTTKIEGLTITNSRDLETTEITIEKVWKDNNDQDGIRPDDITVTLNNGDTVKITKDDNWKKTVTGLQKYVDGEEFVYKVVKELSVAGYDVAYSDDTLTITNTHTPATDDVVVTKVWEDSSNEEGLRPGSITIHLFANGTEVKDVEGSVEKNNDNTWTITYAGLDVYAGGSAISYTVTEDEVTYYTTKIEGLKITNSRKVEYTEIKAEKVWDDSDNIEGLRPGKVTINLLRDEEVIDTVELNKNNTWEYSWNKLNVYVDGKEVTYSITEDKVDNYETEIEYDETRDIYVITNSRDVETTEITITKVWKDNNDQDGIRPDDITVTLNNGDTVKITKDDNWKKTVTGLQKYVDGEEFVYKVVKELSVAGYDVVFSDDTLTITNTHTPATDDVVVTKVWEDNSNKEGLRPESITVHLFANGEEVDATPEIVKNDDNTWTITYKDLDVNANGSEITYTVTEDEVTNYETKIEGLKITNSREVEETEITITKVWEDNDDQDGIRPDSITVTLSNGDEVTLTKEDNWTKTITGLQKYVDGEEVVYTVVSELSVEGYEVTYSEDTLTITNTHTPEETTITVEKVWSDDENESGKRPENVTIFLLANGEEVDSVVLSEENEWKHTFEELPLNANGEKITYTVVEKDVPEDYVVSYEEVEGGFIVHNVLGQGGEEPPENPQTGSNIVLYLIALLISVIGLVSGKLYLKENN